MFWIINKYIKYKRWWLITFPNNERGVENTMHSRVFLMKIQDVWNCDETVSRVFGIIYLLSQNWNYWVDREIFLNHKNWWQQRADIQTTITVIILFSLTWRIIYEFVNSCTLYQKINGEKIMEKFIISKTIQLVVTLPFSQAL